MKITFLLFSLLFSTLSLAQPVEKSLTFQGSAFSYYSNYPLEEKNEKIEQLIIVIHGSERNADGYFSSVSSNLRKLEKTENTLLISPHFKEPRDIQLPGELTWTSEGWIKGDQSLTNASVSSFEIIENFIRLSVNKDLFPSLKRVVITGHSAGGQLTQRFALGSKLEENLAGPTFRYIVANPGSYAYLTKTRAVALPEGKNCEYNNFKHGLDKLNPFMSQSSVEEIRARYVQRDVVYLIGEQDIITKDLDNTCADAVQGMNRLIRAFNFKEILDREFPENRHEIHKVPGVGHSQWLIYTSEIGKSALFN